MKKNRVKLRKINKMKYCPNCNCEVEVIIIGNDGYCPNERSQSTGRYLTKLYTVDTNERKKEVEK